MHDSGVDSFGGDSESDSSPVQTKTAVSTASAAPVMGPVVIAGRERESDRDYELSLSPKHRPTFTVCYFGAYTLDRRYTQQMLPWVMAEVRQRGGSGQMVSLEVEEDCLSARGLYSSRSLFEHKLETMTRFAKTLRDVRCFSYLTKQSGDAAFVCHVYQAEDETMVQQLFDAIRKASVTAVRGRLQSQPSEDSVQSPSRFFEVLYVGKVVLSTKNAPPTFIDDAVKKFEEYEQVQRQEEEEETRMRRESNASVPSLSSNPEKSIIMEETSELRRQMLSDQGSSTEGTQSSESEDAFSESNENVSSLDVNCSLVTSLSGNGSPAILSPGSVLDVPSGGLDAMPSASNGNAGTKQVSCDNHERIPLKMTDGQETGAPKRSLPSQDSRIRTMLIQIGPSELSLISLDRKTTIFERQFKDISFCSQGISHPEHFGFISRSPESGSFTCYVFRCAAELVVEEVMLTLKQAFHSAFEQSGKNLVVCELCPMHQLHKLCHDIDPNRLSPDQMHSTLLQRIGQLNDRDQNEIASQIKRNCPQSLVSTVEVIMTTLLKLSEEKQRSHVHINNAAHRQDRNDFVLTLDARSKPSKFESFRNLAKKSITTSIEHFLGSPGQATRGELDAMSSSSQHQNSEFSIRKGHGPSRKESTLTFKPEIVENLLGTGMKTLNLSLESVQKDVRYRRHSVPHPLASPTFAQPLAVPSVHNNPGIPLNFRRNDRSVSSLTARTHIPIDSPIRSMFVKVGNNVDAKRRRTALEVPSPGIYGQYSIGTHPVLLSPRRSWRLSILKRVVSSSQVEDADFPDDESYSQAKNLVSAAKERIKDLWQKAIFDTILLIRMDKENKLIEEAQKIVKTELKESKLDYEEITPCLKEVTRVWEQMLNCDNRPATKFKLGLLTKAVKDGVPRLRRGEIWQLLVEQHQLHHQNASREKLSSAFSTEYKELLKQLTIHQHAILIDLGRTFPGHPYFSVQLGQGQLSLFNLLKAYSLLDLEVGYCQGLSFVTGVLLMHMPEENAFEILKYLMYNLGFRRQYRPDMVPLQIQMYQLSRLLHDLHRDLYDHFELFEIAPTLYAAPWFLTIFASQFPLGFVGRVFDLVFLQGTDIVLKVALVLLGNHKELIKQCDSFESVVEFLKTTLPEMGIIQIERIINEVFTMNISKQLEAYEVEYHVLQEEMMMSLNTSSVESVDGDSDRVARLQVANDSLRRQKMELLEQLQITRRQIHELEDQNSFLMSGKHKLESQNRALDLERKALLNAVAKLRQFVPKEILASNEFGVLAAINSCSDFECLAQSSNHTDATAS